MKQIDTQCPACGHITVDVLLRVKDGKGEYVMPYCRQQVAEGRLCGTLVTRVFLPSGASSVHGDDIPGGIWIRNGICHDDGSPKRYDTYSSMRKAAKDKNMVNRVEHQPSKGGDRNKNTQRFV